VAETEVRTEGWEPQPVEVVFMDGEKELRMRGPRVSLASRPSCSCSRAWMSWFTKAC